MTDPRECGEDPDPREWGEDHINKSLKQIDSETWFIHGLVIHRSPYPSDVATWNDDSDNSSYTLTVAPIHLRSATTPPDSPYIKLIYEAGDAIAIWSIGNSVVFSEGHVYACNTRVFSAHNTPFSLDSSE